jgi:hypothetical protein
MLRAFSVPRVLRISKPSADVVNVGDRRRGHVGRESPIPAGLPDSFGVHNPLTTLQKYVKHYVCINENFHLKCFFMSSSSRIFRHSSSDGARESDFSSPTKFLSDRVPGCSGADGPSSDSKIRRAREILREWDQVLTRSITSLTASCSAALMAPSPSAASPKGHRLGRLRLPLSSFRFYQKACRLRHC